MTKRHFFCHEKAIVESREIGRGSRVWAFVHILPGARIGADCNICDHVFIENDVVLGDRVTVKCGVQLWDGVHVEDDVFVGPNATFANDIWPRSRQWQETSGKIVLRAGASIGAGATILPGVIIGKSAMVGAGAVVTKSVPPFAVVAGNPAKILRFDSQASPGPHSRMTELVRSSVVPGVTLDVISMVRDLRGNLTAREIGRGLPFAPRRYFVITDVPSREVRGSHAHRECQQMLVCLRGSVKCLVDDGSNRGEYLLDSPEHALHLPAMFWGSQYHYTSDAVLLVLASHPYDPNDYIRDYDEFLSLKGVG